MCLNAPQVGCTEKEKEMFWELMDQELRATLEGEIVIIRFSYIYIVNTFFSGRK